jgi:hypothetical protein
MTKRHETLINFAKDLRAYTSKRETKEAAIIAKASKTLKVGLPHWKG